MTVITPDNPTAGVSQSLANTGANIDSIKQEKLKKEIIPQASKMFQEGNYEGAISLMGKIKPEFLASPAAQAFMQKITPQKVDVTAIDTVNEKGQPTTRLVEKRAGQEFLAPPKSSNQRPLSDAAQMRLADAGKAVEGLSNLTNLMVGLAENKQVGPIAGSWEQVKKVIGTADAQSTELQNMKDFLALGFAAAENRGRPSEKDQKAAEELLGSVRTNPAAALSNMAQVTGTVKENQINAFQEAILFNPDHEDQIKAAARNRGIDLDKESKITNIARSLKENPIRFRRNLELAKMMINNPEIAKDILKDKSLFKDLSKFNEKLEKKGILVEDLL